MQTEFGSPLLSWTDDMHEDLAFRVDSTEVFATVLTLVYRPSLIQCSECCAYSISGLCFLSHVIMPSVCLSICLPICLSVYPHEVHLSGLRICRELLLLNLTEFLCEPSPRGIYVVHGEHHSTSFQTHDRINKCFCIRESISSLFFREDHSIKNLSFDG